MLRFACLALLTVGLTGTAALPAAAQERHALVVGNSKYEGEAALRNPANDADAVEAALKKLNFTVTKKTDVELVELEKAVVEFRRSLKKGSVALFFYAGHGLQVKGENFLVPIKSRLEEEFEVKRKCYGIDQIMGAMDESECALKIVILDCCRDNPLTRSWKRSTGGKGIAAITEIPDGAVIAFATAPGKTAADGRGANSPYTTHLVASLSARPKEGLELVEALKEASRAVKKETGQVPWLNQEASLDKFYLWRDGTKSADVVTKPETRPETRPEKQPAATTGKSTAKAGDFVALFDGKSLTGWSGDPNLWRVKDGAIVGSTDQRTIRSNTYLSTSKSYKNFVLRLKFKLHSGNSGVQFRSKQFENFGVRGFQADIAEGEYMGMLYDEGGTRGILAKSNAAEVKKRYRAGDWNELVITANGPRVTQEINGYKTVDFQDDSNPAAGGVIALQIHAGSKMKVEFKDIAIKELP